MSAEAKMTRRSLGSQIREALDDHVAKRAGTIRAWTFEPGRNDVMKYVLWYDDHSVLPLTPGEMAEYLNLRGYDIRFGRES